MKKHIIAAAFAAIGLASGAQSLVYVNGSTSYSFPASRTGDMLFGEDGTLTVMGSTLPLASMTAMRVDDAVVDDNTVLIAFDGASATVTVAGNIAPYVTAETDGAHVTVNQSPDVSETTCGEITYVLSGATTDGGLTLNGSFKATLELRGVDITNPSGAAIDIQNGKRVELSVKNGTANILADGAAGSQKGALYCKGHLELKGKGTLDVYGNKSHAICAKEYVEMKNCAITVRSAVKDGINCAQYFLMESGTLNIDGVGDDAIQTSYKDDTDREAEDTGTITIEGGTINATVTATAAKGLKADNDVVISGGEIDITVTGGGTWDSDKAKTKAAACVSADGDINISGGTLSLNATAGGGKGMSCDGDLVIDGGDITVTTSGGIYAYVNGTEYQNYTGNTDRLDSDQKSSPKGIKADGAITINGGNIEVTTTGNGAEGIESKSTLTITDGVIFVKSYDDAINSSSHMYIQGGDITVIATNNDGLDTNGNLYLSGGVVRAFGGASPECGIDANEESGYSVFFTGGTLLAVGGGNSTPSSSASTQAYVSGTGSVTAGTTVKLASGSETLATFEIPEEYRASTSSPGMGGRPGGMGGGNSTAILITCPGLASGSSYTLTSGTATSTVTARVTGSGSGRPW